MQKCLIKFYNLFNKTNINYKLNAAVNTRVFFYVCMYVFTDTAINHSIIKLVKSGKFILISLIYNF